jgi:hypothetical protein
MTWKDVGDRTRFTATFRDLDSALFDGNVVLFKLKSPAGTETTYRYGVDAALTRVSLGVYRIEVPWTLKGTWHRRWEVLTIIDDPTSTLVASEAAVQVHTSAFASPILP